MLEYGYDAWGKALTGFPKVMPHLTDSTLTAEYGELARLNPFRYRGYVYDEETGLYYLRTRYYNPTWGRFINQDGAIYPAIQFGNNSYCYCANSPILYVDDDGNYLSHTGFHTAVQADIINNTMGGHTSGGLRN